MARDGACKCFVYNVLLRDVVLLSSVAVMLSGMKQGIPPSVWDDIITWVFFSPQDFRLVLGVLWLPQSWETLHFPVREIQPNPTEGNEAISLTFDVDLAIIFRIYSCSNCRTHNADHDEIISKVRVLVALWLSSVSLSQFCTILRYPELVYLPAILQIDMILHELCRLYAHLIQFAWLFSCKNNILHRTLARVHTTIAGLQWHTIKAMWAYSTEHELEKVTMLP